MSLPIGRMTAARLIGLVLVTVAGLGVVLAGMVIMNRVTHAPEEEDGPTAVDFSVPPPPPPPPPEQPQPPQRPPRRSNQPDLAPLPDVGGSLSGIQVDVPGFEGAGVDQVAESLLGDLDNVALTEDAVDNPPQFRNRVAPEYPERARQRELEGRVLVTALIGVDGRVQQMQVLEANPPGVFNDAVLAALGGSTFDPATYQGNPVETWITVAYPFRLN